MMPTVTFPESLLGEGKVKEMGEVGLGGLGRCWLVLVQIYLFPRSSIGQ